MKVGIVILNYLAYQETIEFVKTIQQQNQKNVTLKIVIVDNHSTNGAGQILADLYREDPQIEVVQAEKNLGFANGNNLGYQVLLQQMQPDYVIAANDDILLDQAGLFAWIAEKDAEHQFGVLGPSVYSPRKNGYQSPMENYTTDIAVCRAQIKTKRKNLCEMIVKRFVKTLLRMDDKNYTFEIETTKRETVADDMTLHGSFLVFARRYLDSYPLLFDEGTYLYMEENILKVRCDAAALPMVYCPDYEVRHMHSVSMTMVNKTRLSLNYFRQKHLLHSLNRYLQVLEQVQSRASTVE